jgi:DNA-binding NarL/FixJ family response regulator
MTHIRILIADDHDVVRAGLRAILDGEPSWEVVAEAADGKEAISKALETKPDVAIIDYSLPILNGAIVTQQIRERLPETEVLIFSMYDDKKIVEDLLRVGARGYLLKSDARTYLVGAIQALAEHRPFFTKNVSEALLQTYLAESPETRSQLTARERTIVQLIAEGQSNKMISVTLNISMKTVETHRASVMRKLNFASPADLVRYAIRNKIIEP